MNTHDILHKLISFPTVSDRETLPLMTWVAEYLRGRGAHVEIIEGAEAGKACLWARLGPPTAGGVVLAGHVDVVPVDEQPWTKEPFNATVVDGRLYGRGACDMKGFDACILALAGRIDPQQLVKPLYIALTYNEEVDMAGAKSLVAWLKEKKIQPDWVWLGEPTEMQVVTAHKGTGKVCTAIHGASVHSGLPHKGVSANEMAVKVCDWIMKKSETFATSPVIGSPFDPPYSSINIGMLHGGKAANIVPGYCEITWQYRLHPGDAVEDLFKEYDLMLENSVRPLLAPFPQTGIKTDHISHIPPFLATSNGEGEKFLCSRTGSGVPMSVSFGTEAGFYQEVAKSVVICGPGSITKAHQADEFVPVADLDKCGELLDACVRSYLMS